MRNVQWGGVCLGATPCAPIPAQQSIVEDTNSEGMKNRWESASGIDTWCVGIREGGGSGAHCSSIAVLYPPPPRSTRPAASVAEAPDPTPSAGPQTGPCSIVAT